MPHFLAIVFFLCGLVFAQGSSVFSGNSNLISGESGISARSAIALQPSYAEVQVDSSYVLGPGDFLDIILENKYLTVQIYPDGTVAIEECGSVVVGGKTLAEARTLILDLVGKRYKRDYTFVQLSSLKRFRVTVMGAVNQVGQHTVEAQTRLSFFIRQVGGVLSNANTEDVRIIRGSDTLHVDFHKLTVSGDFDSDVMLQQGDRIFVPFYDVGENVTLIFPHIRTSVPYKEGRTLQDYYNLSGIERSHNYGYKAVCIREPGEKARWIQLADMGKTYVAKNAEVEFHLMQMQVYVGGSVARIGQVDYNPSWHAIDYIGASGISPVTGSWGQVRVWRGTEPQPISVKVAEDPILPGDYIEIPKSRYESFKDFTLFIASLLTVVSSAFIIYVNYK